MSKELSISAPERALAVLRGAEKPLTTDEILERLPADVPTANKNPRQWLQNHVLKRSEVGRVGRGVYVYLPTHISGSALRMPITGAEVEEGWFRAGLDLAYALWSPLEEWGSIPD